MLHWSSRVRREREGGGRNQRSGNDKPNWNRSCSDTSALGDAGCTENFVTSGLRSARGWHCVTGTSNSRSTFPSGKSERNSRRAGAPPLPNLPPRGYTPRAYHLAVAEGRNLVVHIDTRAHVVRNHGQNLAYAKLMVCTSDVKISMLLVELD